MGYTLFHLPVLSDASPSSVLDKVGIILSWGFVESFDPRAQSSSPLIDFGRIQHLL